MENFLLKAFEIGVMYSFTGIVLVIMLPIYFVLKVKKGKRFAAWVFWPFFLIAVLLDIFIRTLESGSI